MAGKALRVAQVVRPAAGGMRRHVSLLLSRLDRQQFAPVLFAPADFLCAPPVPDVPRVVFSVGARTSPLHDLRAIGVLARRLRGHFDLVHAHGLRGALIGVLAADRAGIPALFTAHNLVMPGGAFQGWILRMLGRHATRIVAVSHAVAHTLIAQGISEEKIVVIPNGIDLGSFALEQTGEAAPAREGAGGAGRPGVIDGARAAVRSAQETGAGVGFPQVVAIGRLAPEKGFDTLMAAFALLQRRFPEARLIVAGSGPEEERLRRDLDALSGASLAGNVPEVAPLLQTADIVAIPSRQEGQGIVALEAMAASRPVVASRVGGLVETIQEGETGLLVPPDDPGALAAALVRLADDSDLRRRMGQAGRARVEQEYTLERMIERITDLYRASAV